MVQDSSVELGVATSPAQLATYTSPRCVQKNKLLGAHIVLYPCALGVDVRIPVYQWSRTTLGPGQEAAAEAAAASERPRSNR